MSSLDVSAVASSVQGMDDVARADMRIEIVKREINEGALAGFDSAITDYAARLVIAALDSFDEYCAEEDRKAELRRGFELGIANEAARARAAYRAKAGTR